MANELLLITTPQGTLYQDFDQYGGVKAKLEWNPDFGRYQTDRFSRAQMYIDNEVLRFCNSRVPFDTGMLQMSGMLGTAFGSGEVGFLVPYAAAQYYGTATSRPYDFMRGGQWFERGKADERERIMNNANRIAGGEA